MNFARNQSETQHDAIELDAAREAVCDALDAAKVLASPRHLTLFRTITPAEREAVDSGVLPADPRDAIQIPIGRILAEGVFARLSCLRPLMEHLDLDRILDASPVDLELTPAKARATAPALLGALSRINQLAAAGQSAEGWSLIQEISAEALRTVRRVAPIEASVHHHVYETE